MKPQTSAADLDTTMAQRQAGDNVVAIANFVSSRTAIGTADASWSFGTRTLRPSSGLTGDRYLATDIGTLGGWLYYWTGTVWEIVVGWAFGTDAQRSALTVSSVDNGAVFYTTDTTKLWTVSGGSWVDRSPATASATQITETGGPTTLTIGAIADGQFTKRVGATLVGAAPSAADPIFTEVSPDQITADQNNYNPGVGSFFRLSTDATRTVTGFVAGTAGKPMMIANIGSFDLVIANQSGSSSAANRVITGTGGDVTLSPDDSAIMLYDGASARWRMF